MDWSKKSWVGPRVGVEGVCVSPPGAVSVERHKAKTPVAAP